MVQQDLDIFIRPGVPPSLSYCQRMEERACKSVDSEHRWRSVFVLRPDGSGVASAGEHTEAASPLPLSHQSIHPGRRRKLRHCSPGPRTNRVLPCEANMRGSRSALLVMVRIARRQG